MMSTEIPDNLKYTDEHEWLDPETGWVGVTDFAQQQLGDVVFVDLPDEGLGIDQGEDFMIVESVKSVSDVYAPVSGTVVDVNENLAQAPEQVNESAYNDGKMIRLEDMGDFNHLMNAEEYESFIGDT